jgi:hypothetical protein
MSTFGPWLPTCALRQVGSYLTLPNGRIYCDDGSGAVPLPGGGYLTNDGRTRITPADPFGGVRIEDLQPDEQPRVPCRETDLYGRCVR